MSSVAALDRHALVYDERPVSGLLSAGRDPLYSFQPYVILYRPAWDILSIICVPP